MQQPTSTEIARALQSGQLATRALIVFSPDGIDSVDLIMGESAEQVKEGGLSRMQELVEEIIAEEWGETELERAGNVRDDFTFDPESEQWHWGQRGDWEVRLALVNEALLASRPPDRRRR